MAKATALNHSLMHLGSKVQQNFQVVLEGVMPSNLSSMRGLFSKGLLQVSVCCLKWGAKGWE